MEENHSILARASTGTMANHIRRGRKEGFKAQSKGQNMIILGAHPIQGKKENKVLSINFQNTFAILLNVTGGTRKRSKRNKKY